MTDVRERVARAIWLAEQPGRNWEAFQSWNDAETAAENKRVFGHADAALLACGYAEMRKALEELTTTCLAEFGEGENEPDNSSVFVGEDNESITFGMLRRARSILERTGDKP